MYTLYNTKLKKTLVHPQVGIWYSSTKEEADLLLHDIHEYVKAIGADQLLPDLIVVKATEINCSNPTS